MPLFARRRDHAPPERGPDAAELRAAYAAMPYPGDAVPETHPRRLATEARLFGLDPAPVEHCRVLEIGCGDGANLVPMAEGLPGADLVGLDLSPETLATARDLAAAAGVENVRFEEGDVAAGGGRTLGEFDYVIVHDVYAGVGQVVRDALLELVRATLAPDGVAYVSFEVLPGGGIRELVRDALRGEVRHLTAPDARVAAARVSVARLQTSPAWSEGVLGAELAAVAAMEDAELFHDVLAPARPGITLGDFAAHADRHRLAWFSEAVLADTVFGTHTPEVAAALTAVRGDRLGWEERLDALTLRGTRRALLCRADRQVGDTPDPEAVRRLLVASPLQLGSHRTPKEAGRVETFSAPSGQTISTDHPLLKAALVELGICWPAAMPYAELLQDARARAGGDAAGLDDTPVPPALAGAYAGGLVELHAQAPEAVMRAGRRPAVTPLARLQAARGSRVVNRWHQPVELDSEDLRAVVAALDGSRTREELAAVLRAAGHAVGEPELDDALRELAALRLLVG